MSDLFEGISKFLDANHVCRLSKHLGTHQFDEVLKVDSAATLRETNQQTNK